jgi:hypothetical protein
MWRQQGQRESANVIRDLFDVAAHGYTIRLTCRGCGRREVLSAPAVWHLFQVKRWRDLLSDVPKRFRCRECGRKGPEPALVRDEPTTQKLPMPSEAEWKRELRRRR